MFIVGNLSAQTNKNDEKEKDKHFKCSEKEIKVCADTIMGITEYSKLQQDAANLNTQLANFKKQLSETSKLSFDDFLNIQDVTIFGEKFQKIQLQEVPKRSKDFYSLVENIHDLNEILTNMESMNIGQLRTLKNNLEIAKEKIDLINSFTSYEKRKVTDFLTESQKQYYRNLVTRYNELYKTVYPDENNY